MRFEHDETGDVALHIWQIADLIEIVLGHVSIGVVRRVGQRHV